MEFERDERKRRANIEKHGVNFLEAALIFEGPALTRIDDRRSYGEARYISPGRSDGGCFVVVHARRGGVTRLISAWRGGRDEDARYAKGLAARASQTEG